MNKIRKYKASGTHFDALKITSVEYIRWYDGFASGSVYPRDVALSDLASRVSQAICVDSMHEFKIDSVFHPSTNVIPSMLKTGIRILPSINTI